MGCIGKDSDMRKYSFAAIALSLFLVGCSGNSNISESSSVSETATEVTTISETVQSKTAESEEESQEPETQQTEIVADETEEPELAKNTEQAQESQKYTIYEDKNEAGNKYITLSVSPEIIYWNKTDKQVSLGEAINIYAPYQLYPVVKDADSLLIYLDRIDVSYPCDFAGDAPATFAGVKQTTSFDGDLFVPVKDGKVNLYSNEELQEPFDYFENSCFLNDMNNVTRNLKFSDGMGEDDFNMFISEVRTEYDDMVTMLKNNPDIECEPFMFEGIMDDGIYFKASVNEIY